MEDLITKFVQENCGNWAVWLVPMLLMWATKTPQSLIKIGLEWLKARKADAPK
jgi:hypothetical protein